VAGVVPDEGRAFQWSFWGMTEVETSLLQALMHRRILPKEQRDAAVADAAEAKLAGPFGVLDGALRGREYLLGGASRSPTSTSPRCRAGPCSPASTCALAAARGVAGALHRASGVQGSARVTTGRHVGTLILVRRARRPRRRAMIVHRSNRTEVLVDALAELVAVPPEDPFAPETIVVQGRGMARWLSLELAGRLGVWANPAFPFPRAFDRAGGDRDARRAARRCRRVFTPGGV
jgi:hypothetical protein